MAASSTDLASYQFTVPQGGDKVYKDECMYCFDTPISDGGIYVCLSTLYAVSEKYLKRHVQRWKKNVFLHLKKEAKEDVQHPEGSPPEKKPTKLAIGIEGGFDVDQKKVEYEVINSLVITDANGTVTKIHSLPDPNLPLNAQLALAAVLSHQGAALQDETKAWEDKRVVSKHAENLVQLNNGVKIPPRGWKCAMCDMTQNLWLNLTDGTILCGRKYFDGSGGNNHALDYYQQTKYPLAVKLGTISAEGGDVYSYDEDDMVEDPKLIEHLKHFGINVHLMEKTDKTMTELEIEANMSLKAEWDTILEAGEKLTPLFGPEYTGMVNLGNSCYMNSVMQTLFSIEEFKQRYVNSMEQIFNSPGYNDPAQDFNVQMAKLGSGLLSGYYSLQPKEETEALGIRPQMIKSLIGKGHPEFSTSHQQDVQEYFMHVMDIIEKNETNAERLQDLFKFQLEERVECSSSNKVRYTKTEELVWGLPIPLDAAKNICEYNQFEEHRTEAEKTKSRVDPESIVRLKIPMQACLEAFASSEKIDDFYSSAIKAKTTAQKITRFSTFPDYLVIQLQKFTISEDWTPKKLDVSVDMLDTIDLTKYLSLGLQAHEQELPEGGAVQEPEINEEFVAMLMDMGFPREACRRAVFKTNNQGVEAAMNWVFEHSQDADFAAPLQVSSGNSNQSSKFNADPEAVVMIMSMGFTDVQARKALEKTNNSLEAAAEWIFTHGDELNAIEIDEPATNERTSNYRHGDGKYQLIGFISHMGTSTSCGHYVCHIIKDGRWVIFNDRKVAVSVNPPKDLGYLYFYKRISQPS